MKSKFIKYSRALQGKILCTFFLLVLLSSCEKFVSVDSLTDKLLAEQVFESDATANAAIAGIYKDMRAYIPSAVSLTNCMVSDEVIPYFNGTVSTYYSNNIQTNDAGLPWASFYRHIYSSNNAIEKLTLSRGISDSSKKKFIAEAKFLRALSYFYLVNLFGDVPLILSTNVETNSKVSRNTSSEIYAQIITDLKVAETDLADDFQVGNGERIRANKWVAKALLARVYLYQKNYLDAEELANEVIRSGSFSLLNTPVGIFNKNNTEAILQFGNNVNENNGIIATAFIYISSPVYKVTDFLLNAFEPGDLRKSTWLRTQQYLGQPVSIPFKLTSRLVNPPEYYTMIRLVEMYLIRSEARAMQDDFSSSISDINIIRLKHGGLTSPLGPATNRSTAMDIILHERQVELFQEGCHRWFDLKRTGRLDAVMQIEKPTTWKSTAALYPIPLTEIQRNPNLTPNPGYQY